MITFYQRPDGAYMKIDDAALVVTNVLDGAESKFIGRFSNPNYVNAIIADLPKFTPIDEAAFTAKYDAVKLYFDNL